MDILWKCQFMMGRKWVWQVVDNKSFNKPEDNACIGLWGFGSSMFSEYKADDRQGLHELPSLLIRIEICPEVQNK